jgi:cupin 2 domain-containing protein
MTPLLRGRLPSDVEAPELGERSEEIARIDGTVIEHIVSGNLAAPVDYDQAHDEWVVVLDGAAILQVQGELVNLSSGDWILLPAHVPHRLVDTLPGTRWLALHAADRGAADSRA